MSRSPTKRYSHHTMASLRAIAKHRKLKNFSNLRRNELIHALEGGGFYEDLQSKAQNAYATVKKVRTKAEELIGKENVNTAIEKGTTAIRTYLNKT